MVDENGSKYMEHSLDITSGFGWFHPVSVPVTPVAVVPMVNLTTDINIGFVTE